MPNCHAFMAVDFYQSITCSFIHLYFIYIEQDRTHMLRLTAYYYGGCSELFVCFLVYIITVYLIIVIIGIIMHYTTHHT